MSHFVFILLLAICGFGNSDGTLNDDIDDFVALFPTDNTISDIVVAYLEGDGKTKAAFESIKSLDLRSLTNLPEFQAVKKFVKDAGLEPSAAINAVSRIFGMSNLAIPWSSEEKSSKVIISEGFEGFIGDVLAAFPSDSIAALREKKLISSPVFAEFVEKITSQEFQERLTALQATEKYRELFKLLSPRVNLFDFVNLFASAIGLGSNRVAYETPHPVNTFQESTDDFIELSSSSDDVFELGKAHFKVASKIRDIIHSLRSDEFAELFNSLKKTEEYLALEKSIQETGINLKSICRKLYRIFLKLATLNGHSDADTVVADESKSNLAVAEEFRKYLEEYRDVRAAEKIANPHRDQCKNSAAYDTLVKRTKSDASIALHNPLKAREQSRKIEAI